MYKKKELTQKIKVSICDHMRDGGNDGGVAPDCKSGLLRVTLMFESFLSH